MPTHGSLTKAGKVRSQTPKIDPTPKKRKGPKVNNRKKYHKRFVLEQPTGQKVEEKRGRQRR